MALTLRLMSKGVRGLRLRGGGGRGYQTLAVSGVGEHVKHVEFNRPEKRNAMNQEFVRELGECFRELHEDSKCRAIVFSGAGQMFSSGLDFGDMGRLMEAYQGEEDVARKFKKMYGFIKAFQNSFLTLEKCHKPVIAAIHGACIGGGTNLVAAADIRYCTADTWFQIKEIELGLAADVGILQWMPKIVGSESLVRELAFTARKMHADEARQCGFVSRIFPDKNSMIDAAVEAATTIAKKSPVAVQGTKVHLIYGRDHSLEESLEHQAIWNAGMLQSEDVMKAVMALMNKSNAEFNDF